MNPGAVQRARIEKWQKRVLGESSLSTLTPVERGRPSYFSWLQTLARSSRTSAPGLDGLPSEVWQRALPVLKRMVYEMMIECMEGKVDDVGRRWKEVELCGIPKDSTREFWTSFRWIGKCDALHIFLRRIVQSMLVNRKGRSEELHVLVFGRANMWDISRGC